MSPCTDVREKMTEQNIQFQFVKCIDLLCEEGHASLQFFPFPSIPTCQRPQRSVLYSMLGYIMSRLFKYTLRDRDLE